MLTTLLSKSKSENAVSELGLGDEEEKPDFRSPTEFGFLFSHYRG